MAQKNIAILTENLNLQKFLTESNAKAINITKVSPYQKKNKNKRSSG